MKQILVICCLVYIGCREKQGLFTLLPGSRTGIHFNNVIVENVQYQPA